MNFLFRSRWGEGLSLARRVMEEGHSARMAICDRAAARVGDRLVDKCHYDDAARSWAHCVVFDCNDKQLPEEADELMAAGTPCLGSSTFAHRLEKNRAFGTTIAKAAGLHIPKWESFSGPRAFEEASKWLGGQTFRHGAVFKANRAGVGTQVADSSEQMERLFRYFAPRFEKLHEPPDFILQEVIKGLEVSTEAWFDGENFSLPNGTLERNKLMPGDIGEKIGSSGEAVWIYPELEAPLVAELVLPLADYLRGRYRGPIDVNAIVDDMGVPWWLEFTPRFGYGAIQALMPLVDDFAGVLWEIANGSPARASSDKFAVGVRIHVPPFPIPPEDVDLAEDLPISGYDPEESLDESGVYPMELALDEHGEPITSGPHGWVAQVVGVGATIEKAARQAYGNIDVLHIPKMRYRNDLGPQMAADYEALEEHKLLRAGGRRRELRPTASVRQLLAARR
jgi:phosphoribosylamine-glycine ligase